jgi:hypothetical protein
MLELTWIFWYFMGKKQKNQFLGYPHIVHYL